MKKIVIFLLLIWALIGSVSLIIWWKVGRGLTPENMTVHANKVAKELEIPWALRFGRIKPAYGADFKIVIEDVEAIAADGTKMFIAKNAEVRLPWMIFFSHNPVRINIAVSDVSVTDWTRIVKEVQEFLEVRKTDRAQQVSIPKHFIESTFNLRLSRLRGPWGEKELALDKLYLLNVDPEKPTAFEVVFPWEKNVGGALISGETKALGEYRLSRQKVDLHYYLKTRLQVQRGLRLRTGDFSVEGKGFFHPRMGLFSTLSAKDDWIALVGDMEWSPTQLKLSVPKFALSHELLLDVLPFTLLHKGNGAYQSSAVQGDFRLVQSKTERDLIVSLRTKNSTKIAVSPDIGDQPLSINLVIKGPASAEGNLTIGGTPWITYANSKNATFTWNPELFVPDQNLVAWYSPHDELWKLLWWLPWQHMTVLTTGLQPYEMDRQTDAIKVTQFKPRAELPMMGLIYSHSSSQIEWSAQFEASALDPLFQATQKEFFLVPGHAYTGAILSKANGVVSYKLAWKGGALPLLSRSSCKALLTEKAELQPLLQENFAHQAEVTFEAPYYRISRWQARAPGQEWSITGEWANSPIKCSMTLLHKKGGRKATPHKIELN